MNTSFRAPASVCNASSASVVTNRARDMAAPDNGNRYYNCGASASSRRTSHASYSQVGGSSSSRQQDGGLTSAGSVSGRSVRNQQWSSYRSDVTGTGPRTPITSGKFRTSFSYRKAEVPEGYPKMDFERCPRRESVVAEFSRKLAEGYDIWEDDDRPVINWMFPRMPSRPNRTQELRTMANRNRIGKMLEREKQMNKRGAGHMMTPVEKRETAWWERPKNGHLVATTNSRYGGGGGNRSHNSRAAWSSGVVNQRYNNSYRNGIAYTPRR